MKRNFSTKFVWTLSLIVMFLWLASNGCTSALQTLQIQHLQRKLM